MTHDGQVTMFTWVVTGEAELPLGRTAPGSSETIEGTLNHTVLQGLIIYM